MVPDTSAGVVADGPGPTGSNPLAIRPTPTEEEAAAIVAAVEMLWPRPVPGRVSRDESTWRFSGRWWGESRGWPRRRYR